MCWCKQSLSVLWMKFQNSKQKSCIETRRSPENHRFQRYVVLIEINMHNVEDEISDSEDDITTFLEPVYRRHVENRPGSEIQEPTLFDDMHSTANEEKQEMADSEEVYFHMTQMQSIHESVTELEKECALQKKSMLSLRSLRCDSVEEIEKYQVSEPPKKRSKRRMTTESKTRKKNQSMSDHVREVFESDRSKYFIAKQSRIDEFCARSQNTSMSRTLQNRRLEQPREKQLLSSSDWLHVLRSLKINFPNVQCVSGAPPNGSFTYRTLWDEACANVTLNHEELKILYNK